MPSTKLITSFAQIVRLFIIGQHNIHCLHNDNAWETLWFLISIDSYIVCNSSDVSFQSLSTSPITWYSPGRNQTMQHTRKKLLFLYVPPVAYSLLPIIRNMLNSFLRPCGHLFVISFVTAGNPVHLMRTQWPRNFFSIVHPMWRHFERCMKWRVRSLRASLTFRCGRSSHVMGDSISAGYHWARSNGVQPEGNRFERLTIDARFVYV